MEFINSIKSPDILMVTGYNEGKKFFMLGKGIKSEGGYKIDTNEIFVSLDSLKGLPNLHIAKGNSIIPDVERYTEVTEVDIV